MKTYDAIVVGARCAGSPTAMLLARKGYRVLVVDRATFPSDTISTHLIHPPGLGLLKRWGLFDRVVATGCPLLRVPRHHTFPRLRTPRREPALRLPRAPPGPGNPERPRGGPPLAPGTVVQVHVPSGPPGPRPAHPVLFRARSRGGRNSGRTE